MSVHALKIPNPGSHTMVWTLEHTAHTDRNGYSTVLLAAAPYPGEVT